MEVAIDPTVNLDSIIYKLYGVLRIFFSLPFFFTRCNFFAVFDVNHKYILIVNCFYALDLQ